MTEQKTLTAQVTVYPRPEILDPQGKAISKSLARNGFGLVTEVRAGKSFRIELAAADRAAAESQLAALCEKVLANPLLEDFEIEILDEGASR